MTQDFQKTNRSHLSSNQLFHLEQKAAQKLDELLEALGISNILKKNSRTFCGCCPIHGGDKQTAFSIFHQGDTILGNWRCYTKNCHNTFHPTVLGLIRGVLSRNNGWSVDDGVSSTKIVHFNKAIKFLTTFLNGEIGDLHIDEGELEKQRFNKTISYVSESKEEEVSLGISREMLRKSISIPAEYYISHNPPFSSAILDKYDVGLCNTPKKQMNMRAVVPIYDDDYKEVVGVTGRSIFNQCINCKFYHNQRHQCPSGDFMYAFTKWRHNSGFRAERHLYNFWFARKFIEQSNVVILTESPGNVWRLEECGFHNSLATFGAHLTTDQRMKLDSSGALSLILLYDPDKAGIEATTNIIQSLGKLYNIIVPNFGNNDIADTPKDRIINTLNPIINSLAKEYN